MGRAVSSIRGSTGLVRLAGNPACKILGAMVMQEGSEKRLYEQVVGQPYDREFGERQSSKRRGAQFERNATPATRVSYVKRSAR